MADTQKQIAPQKGIDTLPGGSVPMEDYYMPDLDNQEESEPKQSN